MQRHPEYTRTRLAQLGQRMVQKIYPKKQPMDRLLVAGPLVAWIVAGLEGAIVGGGISAIGAALFSIGIPRNSVLEYETSIEAGKFLLVATGTEAEVDHAREILQSSRGAESVARHGAELQPAL